MDNGITERNLKHGEAYRGLETLEYKSWRAMMSRCYSLGHSEFRHYGDKGIKVCERWQEYSNFLEDMGRKPTSKHTIGRKDHSKDYTPENCEWQTRTKQGRNTTRVKVTMPMAKEIRWLWNHTGLTTREIGRKFDIHHSTVWQIVNHVTWKEGR